MSTTKTYIFFVQLETLIFGDPNALDTSQQPMVKPVKPWFLLVATVFFHGCNSMDSSNSTDSSGTLQKIDNCLNPWYSNNSAPVQDETCEESRALGPDLTATEISHQVLYVHQYTDATIIPFCLSCMILLYSFDFDCLPGLCAALCG